MSRHRSGAILFAVLLMIVLSTTGVLTMLYRAGGDSEIGAAAGRLQQGRALAWSGVQAIMAQFVTQRDQLLSGEDPEVVGSARVFVDQSTGAFGVFRLISSNSVMLQPESSKVDVNIADAAALGAALVAPELAESIVGARGSGFHSVCEIMLQNPSADDEASDEAPPAPAHEVLTVFAADPNVQSSDEARSRGQFGEPRINLGAGWSDELGRQVERRFDANTAAICKAVLGRGETLQSESDLVRILRQAKVPTQEWAEILDAYTTESRPFIRGRVDVNRASPAVLRSVPGISEAAADKIVAVREGLDPAMRSSVCWPLLAEALSQDEFEAAVNHLTTRCMQWRFTIEGGMLAAEDDIEGGRLRYRVRLEAVIDIAGDRPRVSYLRDVTLLESAQAIAAQLDNGGRSGDDAAEDPGDQESENATTAGVQPRLEIPDLHNDLDFDIPDTFVNQPPRVEEPTKAAGHAAPEPASGKDDRIGRWTTGKAG